MAEQSPRIGRERFLEVAETLFTRRGFQAVSIRDIAQACGVTNAALYYHFDSKEALFSEVMELHVQRLSADMRLVAAQTTSPKARLRAMLKRYSALAASDRSPIFLLRHRSKGFDRERKRQQQERLFRMMLEPLEEALTDAAKSGQLRALSEKYSAASILLGMLHGMMQQRKLCQSGELTADDVDTIVDLFWHGLQPVG